MATTTQGIIFTVCPFGQVLKAGGNGPEVYLNFSVFVSPRLGADTSDQIPLDAYPDWAANPNINGGRTWPETVGALFSAGVTLTLINLPGTPVLPAVQIGTIPPDAATFAAVFPDDTPVTPYTFQGMETRKIRSAPVASVVTTIADLYGRFALASPTAFPNYDALVPVDAFGPIGFQQDFNPRTGGGGDPGIAGNGAARKQRLVQALENFLVTGRAIPYDLSGVAATLDPPIPGAVTSLQFLEHQRFLQRGLPAENPPQVPVGPPQLDFHQRVAGLGSMPTLMRTLGLVLDLQAGPVPASAVNAWQNGAMSLVALSVPSSAFRHGTSVALPAVQSLFAPGVFRPAPLDASNTDHFARMLKLGDATRYHLALVDHDNAVIKTMQFANTVTRSRKDGQRLTLTTPERFALPALRSGGFSIARSGRAVQMADTLSRQTGLNGTMFNVGAATTLFEDDITRGYRVDVLHVQDGVWRSLMWRTGTITVNGLSPMEVTEEDAIVPAPTTASVGPSDPGDLYLQETLARWDGWSLAVPRVGRSFSKSSQTTSTPGSSGFNVTTDWHVPGSVRTRTTETNDDNAQRLPRLRFGAVYRLRARAADLCGNSLPVDSAPTSGIAISPAFAHVRFEPVAAPRALFVKQPELPTQPLPGDSEEVVVVRSESATVDTLSGLDNATAVRLLIPAPISVVMAEQHGAFDGSATGHPMVQADYASIAKRDAVQLNSLGSLAHSGDPGTANPYVFPPFLPITYLPDVLGRTALVRNLPHNSVKKTVAELPFDTAGAGWPRLQAVRVVLSRGPVDWSTPQATDPQNPANLTTELDLTLDKGDMVTTLVNCKINQNAASIMGIWIWIQRWASAHGLDPTPAWNAILAGEHWMVTPWRQITFVHAVRTPLQDPVLYLLPTKADIGQTFALFAGVANPPSGTVAMSRKSTARIDVDGNWTMPVDTGSNDDPVTPQSFHSHAFTLELNRVGFGRIPGQEGNIPDAQNFVEQHEFNDTKFRAVTYQATATSFYVEYFREERELTAALGPHPIIKLKHAPFEPGVAFESSTVVLTVTGDLNGQPVTRKLVPAPAGTNPAARPVPGDYLVVADPNLDSDPANATHGTIQLLANETATRGLTDVRVFFSYVGPRIHTYSDPAADHTAGLVVPNSARPRAPKVLYAIPIYKRTTTAGKLTRRASAVRVYLERPWWSSGDGERLGVVCWHPSAGSLLPPDELAPYVTLWGYDPVFKSTRELPAQPTPACFPLLTAERTNGSLSIEETTDLVDVAGHDVGFDAARKLWYCDIRVTNPSGKQLGTYTPFIRFAFARYQPNSIDGAHLSRVVTADFAQLTPDRSVTVTGTGSTRTVVVAGRAPTAVVGVDLPSRMTVTVEQQDTRIADDALAWGAASGPTGFTATIELTPSVTDVDEVTWRGNVALPSGNSNPLRLTFEEYERLPGGFGVGRLVFTDSLPIS